MKNILNNLFVMVITFITCTNYCVGQASSSSPIQPAPAPNQPFSSSPPDFLGWDATVTIPLQIRQDNISTPYSIEFWTNAVMQMEIDGATGNVGMGTAPLSPFKLTVNNDINIASNVLNHGYHIGGSLLLSSPGTEYSYFIQ